MATNLTVVLARENSGGNVAVDRDPCCMDQTAFHEFYLKTAPALRSYLSRSCGSYDLAEDVMQEAFLRFLRTAPKDLEEPAMKGYLYRTAQTILIDHWRRSKRSQRWSLEMFFRKDTPPDRDKTDDMTTAFRDLNPQQQSLLWLAYVEGFDHREIAAAAGVKEKSVRVLLFRARKALAALLEGK